MSKSTAPTIHPFAECAPPMTEAEFAGLKETIKSRLEATLPPLIHPIVLLDGMILDGRHRQRACDELDVSPSYEPHDPKKHGDPLTFVVDQACHRNPTESQRAAMAVSVEDALKPAKAEKSKANLKNARPGNTSGSKVESGDARDVAGRKLGVSGRYVSEARVIKQQSPELFTQVLKGTVKISEAKRAIHNAVKRIVHAKKAATLPATAKPEDHFTLHVGDCLQVMPTLPRRKYRLICTDTPYNQGIDYGKGSKADKLPPAEFRLWLMRCIGEMRQLLTPDGKLAIIISWEWAADIELVLRDPRIGLHLVHRIIWYETFGNNCSDNFNRTSRPILVFAVDPKNHVFNKDVFNRPSDRQEKYGDARANPAGKLWDDVWGVKPLIPRLVDNSPERLPGFPTQLPLALVEPIVRGFSEPGDHVLDPFNGSGTTGAACVKHGRLYDGIDISPEYVKRADERLRGVLAERLAEPVCKPLKGNVDAMIREHATGMRGRLDAHLRQLNYRGYDNKSKAAAALDVYGQSAAGEKRLRQIEGELVILASEFIADHQKKRGSK